MFHYLHPQTRGVLSALLTLVILACTVSCTQTREEATAEIKLLVEANRVAEAMPRLEKLIDQYPDDRELNNLYGSILLASGNASMSIWPLRKATEAPEAGPEDFLLLGTAHLKGGSPNDAIVVVDHLLEETPGIIEAYELRIEANMALGQNEKALEDLEFILDDQPDNEEALLARASMLLELERPEEAKDAIADAREVMGATDSPDEWKARFCAVDATFIFEKGEENFLEDATEAWETCLEEFPTDELIVSETIRFFDEHNQRDRGVPILRNAIELEPTSSSFHMMLANRLKALGELEEAEELMRKSIELPGGGQGRVALIDLLSEEERYAEALAVLEDWISTLRDPSMSMRILRADLMVRAQDFDAAEKAIAELEKPEFRNVLNGRLELERGNPERALELLTEGIALWPSNAVARVLAAEAAEQLGDLDRAFAEYVEASRSDPTVWEPLERLGAMHVAMRRTQPMGQLLGRYTNEHPRDMHAWRVQFEVGLASNNEPLTRSAINAFKSNPGGKVAATALEARWRARKGPGDAANFITGSRIKLTAPEAVELLEVLIDQLSRLSLHDAALSRTAAAVKAAPEFAMFHVLRGRALEGAGSPPEEIRAAFERAVELAPELPDALVALGRREAADGKVDAALARFDRAAEADPSETDAEWAAIEALRGAGREAEAAMRVDKLLARRIEHTGATVLLAQRHLESGDAERAIVLSQRAIRLSGGIDAVTTLGRAYRGAGKPDEAISTYRRWIEFQPKSPSILYELGVTLAETGDKDGARIELDKALEIGGFAEEEDAKQVLSRLEQ